MNNPMNHLIRRSVESRAALPPLVTVSVLRVTDPGLRYRMAAYDATHAPARGVIVDRTM